ncbi:MAG: AgmX/PglI C-terminal domain-containing protein [Sandaracinaceae bacterium]
MRTLALSALLLALPLGASAQATEIQETLRQAHPAIRACVERSVAAGEQPADRVDVMTRIEPSGRVSEARVSRPEAHPRFARCVESAVERLRFPRQTEAVTVRFPLWTAPRR